LTEASSDGAACNVGVIAPRHFAVDMVQLSENLHDRKVRRAGADEQGATIVFAPIRLVWGPNPRSTGRRIAPLCNRLHYTEDCLRKARARQ
jgi:hypothetical protein